MKKVFNYANKKKFDCKYFNSVDLAYENAYNDSKKLILFLLVEVLSLSRNFKI